MSEKSAQKSRGNLVAKVLASVWRSDPQALDLTTQDLSSIMPLLLGSGAGASAWWRIRHSELRDSPVASPLLEAYRFQTINAALHEESLKKVIAAMRARGIEPLLVKGWAVARLYPETGLRLSGDIDLCIRPEQMSNAVSTIRSLNNLSCPIDLHRGFRNLDDHPIDDLYARSQLLRLGDVEVRTPSPEDHLRIVCLHALRHGLLRPLWLCDIAVAIESRPADFDWELCLSIDKRRADWIACAVGLAHQLLGARIEDTPFNYRSVDLPKWLGPTVLRQWGVLQTPQGQRVPMRSAIRQPWRLPAAVRLRWPNPIEATVDINGPFNEWPRLPFQLGDCVARTARFLGHSIGLREES